MGIIPHLTESEMHMFETYVASLDIQPRTTNKSVCVATVGLVGSGKTTFCKIVSRELPATHIGYDNVKVLLQESEGVFTTDSYRNISLHAIMHIIKNGGNVTVDNDNIESHKRKYLYDLMRANDGSAVFVHLKPSIDVLISRIIDDKYTAESILSNTPCSYGRDHQTRAATARIRALFERLPYHFTWNERSRRWEPKAIDRSLTLSLDTGSQRAESAMVTLVKHIRMQN